MTVALTCSTCGMPTQHDYLIGLNASDWICTKCDKKYNEREPENLRDYAKGIAMAVYAEVSATGKSQKVKGLYFELGRAIERLEEVGLA